MFSVCCRAIDAAIRAIAALPLELVGGSGVVPAAIVISIWAFGVGVATMWLYGALSDQEELEALESEVAEAREAMRTYDGTDFEEMKRRTTRALGLSMQQLRLIAVPTLLAGLPVVGVLVWMEGTYAHRFPDPGETVEATVHAEGETPGERVDWHPDAQVVSTSGATSDLRWPEAERSIELRTADGSQTLLALPLTHPVRSIETPRWTHWLFDEAGHQLPVDAPIRRVTFDWPRLEVVSFGPGWMRGWHGLFLIVLSIAAGGTKWGLGIA